MNQFTPKIRRRLKRQKSDSSSLSIVMASCSKYFSLSLLSSSGNRASLTEATNALSQDVRAYELQEHRVKLGGSGDFPDDYPQIRAVGITEPDGARFEYGVRPRGYRTLTFAMVETPAEEARHRYWCAEAWCSVTGEQYDVLGLTKEQVIDDLLAHYSRWISARTEVTA